MLNDMSNMNTSVMDQEAAIICRRETVDKVGGHAERIATCRTESSGKKRYRPSCCTRIRHEGGSWRPQQLG